MLALISCRNEFDIGREHQHSLLNEKMKIRKLIGKDAQQVSNTLNQHLQSTNNQLLINKTDFGEIDYTEISEAIDSLGITNYTFRILNHPEDNFSTFHNLVLSNENNELKVYLIKYEMANETALQLQNSGTLESFEGTVTSSNFDGDDGHNPGDGTGGTNTCNPTSTGTGGGGGTGTGSGSGGGGGGTSTGGGYCATMSISCNNCGASYGSWSDYGSSACNGYAVTIYMSYIACRQSCNPGGGVVVSPPKPDPCQVATIPTNVMNLIMKNFNVNPKLNSLQNLAQTQNFEYGVTISENSNGAYIATDPYTDNLPGQVSIIPPVSGNYISNAHSHPDGGASPPSIGDLYSDSRNAENYPTFKGSFIYSSDGSVYALVITDRDKALEFLTKYPETTNLTDNRQLFNEESLLGKDYNKIYGNMMKGTYPDYSGKTQNDALETALVYVLEKYNAGISIAKKDTSGNLKPIKPTSFQYTIPASGGKVVTAYKTEMCP